MDALKRLAPFAALMLVAACAPGANEVIGVPDADGDVAGFWMGLWHGLIAPITFIISLFTDRVEMYEVHNNGGWYNFGFLLGLMCGIGGGANRAGASSRSRRKA